MNFFNPIEFATAIIFYSIIILLLYKHRKKAQVESKVVYLFRLNYGIKFMNKIGNKLKPLWKIIGSIGIIVVVYFMLYSTWLFYSNMQDMFIKPESAEKSYILIPGVPTPGSPIYVPFWFGILSLIIAMLVHETSHGISSMSEDGAIKSSGVGMFLFMPLAFVEPDNEKIQKMSILQQMRIYAAGPFSNIILSFLVLLLITNIIDPALSNSIEFTGIEVSGFIEGYPLESSGISEGEIITAINGIETLNYTAFSNILLSTAPNTTITLTSNKGEYILVTAQHPDNSSYSYIGVYPQQAWGFKEEAYGKYGDWLYVLNWISELLFWLVNLSFILGVMNCLPIGFADGGRIFHCLVGLFVKDEKLRNKISNIVSYFVITIIVINVAGAYILP